MADTIVVGYDDSDGSRAALDHAVGLARRAGYDRHRRLLLRAPGHARRRRGRPARPARVARARAARAAQQQVRSAPTVTVTGELVERTPGRRAHRGRRRARRRDDRRRPPRRGRAPRRAARRDRRTSCCTTPSGRCWSSRRSTRTSRGRRVRRRRRVALEHLFAEHLHVAGRLDPEPHLVAAHLEHRDGDVVADDDALVDPTGEHQHGHDPFRGRPVAVSLEVAHRCRPRAGAAQGSRPSVIARPSASLRLRASSLS